MELTEVLDIIIDYRDRDLAQIFHIANTKKLFNITTAQLPIGDVVCEKIVVERKRMDDLVGSVMDGRLWNQSLNMSQSEMIPLLITVGTLEEWMPGWNKWSRYKTTVDSGLIYGAFASVMLRYGGNIAWVPDDVSFVKLCMKLFEKFKENKVAIPSKIQMMVKNRDKRVEFLKVLYGITERSAQALLKNRNLADIMTMRYSDLVSLPGIGEITAKKIVELNTKEKPYGK